MAYNWDKTRPVGTQPGSDMDDAIRDTRAGVEDFLDDEHVINTVNPTAVTCVHKDGFCKTEYLADAAVTVSKLATATVNYLVPPGAVLAFARSTPPDGWLECNGQAVSRTTYAALFAAIGTTFGAGNGSTTFNLPDLRGEFIRGWDHGRGVDSGRAFGSTQADAFGAHTHGYRTFVNPTPTGYRNESTAYSGEYSQSYAQTRSTTSMGDSETRPRNIALMYCIKH